MNCKAEFERINYSAIILNQAMGDDSGSWWWWINVIGKKKKKQFFNSLE